MQNLRHPQRGLADLGENRRIWGVRRTQVRRAPNSAIEKVRIYLRREKGDITELLIVNRSDDDASMVQLKGKIKESEIGNLVKADFD